MSAELIATLSCFITLGIGMFAGFAWVVRRMDAGDERLENKLGARIDTVESKLGARIDTLETKLGARIDAVETKLGARIDALAGEVTDLKVAVARIEGPPRHLIQAR